MDLQSLNDELKDLRNQGVALVNLTEVARGLGIRPGTARAWAEQGRCPALWMVGRWKSDAGIMRRWLDAEEAKRQPKPGRKTAHSVRKGQILKAESQLKAMGVI